jgi:hypothetical protein
MSVKLDLSEDLVSYTEEIENSLRMLENEMNSVMITLNPLSKGQISKIEDLISNCENNVNL